MKLKGNLLIIGCLLLTVFSFAQPKGNDKSYSKADTLRGTITEFRKGWDILKYNLQIDVDINNKSIAGSNEIIYKETSAIKTMQVDLQTPMSIDSIIDDTGRTLQFENDNNVWLVKMQNGSALAAFVPRTRKIKIYYHGVPKEAVKAPWDGGVVWNKDTKGNPFVATACEGIGASVWWPCKDHLSDEPDEGMMISITAPDTLTAISNGRLKNVSASNDGSKTWLWEVKNPINNYAVTLNIGKYSTWSDTLNGEKGKLDLQYWVLDYNLEKARQQFQQVKPMLRSFEHWFGPYPFYEDSYKLVETPFLGMEHQSGVAYGNGYSNGYKGRDLSGTGWGMKWDFIIVHESGHEWFGNNITAKDIADMWVHEGFTNYSEVLYTGDHYGKQAAIDYCSGIRSNIKNDIPIIGTYNVNKQGSSDMYYKAANMINMIRNTVNDDSKFRNILRGLNRTFYHRTVTTQQIENYISEQSGYDLKPVFDQYLRTTQIPVLEYYFDKNKSKVFYRWANCVKGFNLPVFIKNNKVAVSITPAENWKSQNISAATAPISNASAIEKNYLIEVKQVAAAK
ncbi:MAG: M1 family metallopeptidase [Segetibacter sp.]|nr:M1 family metallopeptidase [Segetibacter sp.]